MQQVPVEMFENRSALIADFERGDGLAQAALIGHSLQPDS